MYSFHLNHKIVYRDTLHQIERLEENIMQL